jgi:hypothetical protein
MIIFVYCSNVDYTYVVYILSLITNSVTNVGCWVCNWTNDENWFEFDWKNINRTLSHISKEKAMVHCEVLGIFSC